jgi:hypothetical protein
MEGLAILTLLKARSQNNSYSQAVHSTYLMATGAQRQHFTVLSSLGISMGYTSVINQHAGKVKANQLESAQVAVSIDLTAPIFAINPEDSVEPSDLIQPSVEELPNTCPDHTIPANTSVALPKKKPKKRTLGTLFQLSQVCRATARRVGATGLFSTVYDNINMMIRIAEQILGRKSEFYTVKIIAAAKTNQKNVEDAQENGTCATVIPLHNVWLEDLSTEHHNNGIMNAPPLTLNDLDLTKSESVLFDEAFVHTVLRIIVNYGGEGFQQWKEDLEKCQPKSTETIDIHQTPLHPLPAMEIDENSTTGNVKVIETISSELGLDTDSPEFTKSVKIIAGDQLTIARQRAILNVRIGQEDGADAWKHIILMPGLFHTKIVDCHGLLQMHLGRSSTRSPGSLAFHNT